MSGCGSGVTVAWSRGSHVDVGVCRGNSTLHPWCDPGNRTLEHPQGSAHSQVQTWAGMSCGKDCFSSLGWGGQVLQGWQ